MRLKLEYLDQNEAFAQVLPQRGVVARWVSSAEGSKWALLRLDAPVEYRGRAYEYFLLRSRWQGHELGAAEPMSVFVLLVDNVAKVIDGFDVKDFRHVVWGMAHAVD